MAGRRLAVLVAFVLLLGGSPAWAGITTTGPTMVPPVKGGTGLDTSASTGYLHILTGAWSVIPTIPTSDLSGSVACSQLPALTGGVTTSAGSCATTVITNANLTGPITSAGNATAIASQTGTGTTFVMDTAPTVVGGSVTALTTLSIRDASAAFNVILRAQSSPILTADRSVTLNVENASSTVTIAGNSTLADWFDQSVKTTASPAFSRVTSTIATGTAPFVVTSTTLVSNLYVARAALGDTVTTNANLTGVVTSVGNATSFASAPTFAGTVTSGGDVLIQSGTVGLALGSVTTNNSTANFSGTVLLWGLGPNWTEQRWYIAGSQLLGLTATAYAVSTPFFLAALSATGVGDTYICINPTTKEVRSGVTCAASVRSVKENIRPLTSGVAMAEAMAPSQFTFKPSYRHGVPAIGFIADDLVQLDERFALRSSDGTLLSYDERAVLAVAIQAVKELSARVQALEKAP